MTKEQYKKIVTAHGLLIEATALFMGAAYDLPGGMMPLKRLDKGTDLREYIKQLNEMIQTLSGQFELVDKSLVTD
jgi:hypothetical protein